ncbi:MAG TPA: rhodanese-like domain-containing protein [Phycisphaerae bacterium]|nr:rhodanese-like domain-containing protein [Phycisphaerae bacterium]
MSVKTIIPTEVYMLMQSGHSPAIIDVRTPAEYATVHIAGSRLMPLDSLDPAALAAERENGEPLYVICQAGARAVKACEHLMKAGVPVYCIEGGIAAWRRSGLPVQRGGGKVISLERQVRIVAGSFVLIGTLLAWGIQPLFFILPAFVGAGLIFAGVSDYCGMAMLLSKMPWNKNG